MVLYVFAFTEAEGLIISIWDMVACICIICVAFLLFFDSRNSFGTRLLHLFWLVLGILCVTNFPWGTWLPTIIFVAHPSCRPTALLLTAACVLALRALTPFVKLPPPSGTGVVQLAAEQDGAKPHIRGKRENKNHVFFLVFLKRTPPARECRQRDAAACARLGRQQSPGRWLKFRHSLLPTTRRSAKVAWLLAGRSFARATWVAQQGPQPSKPPRPARADGVRPIIRNPQAAQSNP